MLESPEYIEIRRTKYEALKAENARLRAAAIQLGEAVDWAHAEGFEWPSDPWHGIDRAALENDDG